MKIIIAGNNPHAKEMFTWAYNYCMDNSILTEVIPYFDCKIKHFPAFYDVGISFLYPHLIPKEELHSSSGQLRWINFHPSYRTGGRNLAYHAIMNGDKEFGSTTTLAVEEFDAGPIIMRTKFPISDEITAGDINQLSILGLKEHFKVIFSRLVKGENIPIHPPEWSTYYKCQPIDDFIYINSSQAKEIRAKMAGKFTPKIKIGNRIFKIVEDKSLIQDE